VVNIKISGNKKFPKIPDSIRQEEWLNHRKRISNQIVFFKVHSKNPQINQLLTLKLLPHYEQ